MWLGDWEWRKIELTFVWFFLMENIFFFLLLSAGLMVYEFSFLKDIGLKF